MDTLVLDLRYAIRSLRRSPRFTALAVLTLGLGIGTASAGFGILYRVLLDPLPGVRDPGRMGLVWFAVKHNGSYMPEGLEAPNRAMVSNMSPAVESMAGIQFSEVDVAAPDQAPRRVPMNYVSGNYFTTLGARPALGRLFTADDDPPNGGSRVAVIGNELWRDAYGGRPDIIGQRLAINALSFIIVGVMPDGFKGTERFQAPSVWLPGNVYFDVNHYRSKQSRVGYQPPSTYPYLEHVVRIRPGASFEQAETQLKTAIHSVALADSSDFDSQVTAEIFPGLGLQAMGRDIIRHQVGLILGIAGLVLLITCANVANLMLLRRIQRRADIAVRLVLGAGRWRVARLFLFESGLVGLASGAAGVAVALALREVFGALRLLNFLDIGPVTIDGWVLTFAAAAGILASLLAGAIPAVFGIRAELAAQVKASGPTQVGGAPRVRTGLAILQVAVSLTLVAGAYLMARTLKTIADIPLGFNPAGVTAFGISPRMVGYSDAQGHAYYRELEEQLRGLAGITNVAVMDQGPLQAVMLDRLSRADIPGSSAVQARDQQVSAAYFSTVGIPLLAGTGFAPGDAWRDSSARPRKTIISESLAHHLFGATSPLGALIATRGGRGPELEVVGVAGDVRQYDPTAPSRFEFYEPLGQSVEPWQVEVDVKSSLPSATVVREVQELGKKLDPSLPVQANGTLSQRVAATVATQTLLLKLVGAISLLCLLLTAVGVYAIVAYSVSTRTREFGVRMALGAEQKNIVRTALGSTPTIVAGGVLLGILGALYLTKFIAASLYGVSRFDPFAFATAALVLALAVFVASWLPARRAAKIDPMVALRYE